jgi:transcription antitermination factor NusG
MEEQKKSEYNWFALYTNSRAEKKAADKLKQAGIEVYLPVKRVLHQWSDRKKWVEMPVINSYIFVCISRSQTQIIYSTPGIVAFVCDKGKPAIIPAQQIEAMQRTVDSQLNYTLEQNTLKKGELIRMTSGPLAGIIGEITQIRCETRLFLRIPHLGYGLSVDVKEFSFEKVDYSACQQ